MVQTSLDRGICWFMHANDLSLPWIEFMEAIHDFFTMNWIHRRNSW
jgi:hypothetical protein